MPVNSSTRRGLETAPEAAQLQAQPRLALEVRAASPTVQQVPTTAGGQGGSPSAKGVCVCRRATEMAPGVRVPGLGAGQPGSLLVGALCLVDQHGNRPSPGRLRLAELCLLLEQRGKRSQ